MSMPLPADRRAAYDALFTGDDSPIHEYFSSLFPGLADEEKVERRFLNEDGTVRPEWAENYCMAYPLPKDKTKVLLAAEAGELKEVDPVVRGFQRLGLVDNALRLTSDGRFKLIAALPLQEQVRRLNVVYEEFSAPKVAGTRTERYVTSKYEEQGFECFHDEGGALAVMRTCSLLTEMPTLRELCTDNFALESPITSNLAQLFSQVQRLPDGTNNLSPQKVERFCEILARTTPERIAAGWQVSLECAERNRYDSGMRNMGRDKVIRLFEALGIERFVRLCRLELEDMRHWGGWPDITAFKGREVVLTEVKQKDKLMFHQARTLQRLAAVVPEIISGVRVARLTLN
jgi:hypothetical protein